MESVLRNVIRVRFLEVWR